MGYLLISSLIYIVWQWHCLYNLKAKYKLILNRYQDLEQTFKAVYIKQFKNRFHNEEQ